jgi:transcriptional regulator with GAF, ATPase, and Fis domain
MTQRDDLAMTATFLSSVRSVQVRKVKLRVESGPDAGTEVELSKPRISVGRSAVNELVLADTSVSGAHLEFVLGDRRGVLVRDLGSTNGTSVNGVRIQGCFIEPGARISLGKTELALLATNEVEVPLAGSDRYGALYGSSPGMREVFATLGRIAGTDMSVLVEGETGTGKELVARALHDESPRAKKPFVVLDCGSMPRELAEAAILGHKRGSFTGAIDDRPGAFEEANGGTLFLDEIGELPLDLQPKLLRVLDRREVQRVGEVQVRNVDVRVVAATHRNLRQMVGTGKFREDLYFRLSVMNVELPPLRDRGDDIVMLARRFLDEFHRAQGRRLSLSSEAKAALAAEPWPGNVRQLKNTVERAAYLARGDVIESSDLRLGRWHDAAAPRVEVSGGKGESKDVLHPDYAGQYKESKASLIDKFEREYFSRLMLKHRHYSDIAAEAGITRHYLRDVLRRHGLTLNKDKD